MFSRYSTTKSFLIIIALAINMLLSACETTQPSDLTATPASIWISGQPSTGVVGSTTPTLSFTIPPTRAPGSPILTPTPDPQHYQIKSERGPESYIVQPGDMLSAIAQKFSVSLPALAQANNIIDVNALEVGQILTIPYIPPKPTGPAYKIIPDSELLYGPLSIYTDVETFIRSKGGYLSNYTQEVNGENLTAAQIVLLAAQNSSVNPRLLLAILEHCSGWLTNPNPDPALDEQPFGFYDTWYHGLYRQLEWAAIHLNSGYYRWRTNRATDWVLADGSVVPADPTINAGTAGVQNFFAQLDDYSTWLQDVAPGGFSDTYQVLFGYPFDLAIEPIIPANLVQPPLLLPFETGIMWSYTSGPHLAWDAGSPFGALDFAPAGTQGCNPSDAWVTAVADGPVIRTYIGSVYQDLDGDGNEGSGWVILYMHIEARGRVQAGAYVHAGERIGHPSCEGGISSGTHLHIARKFNGEWISAGSPIPFNLEGWLASGSEEEGVGTLKRYEKVLESYNGSIPSNQIQR